MFNQQLIVQVGNVEGGTGCCHLFERLFNGMYLYSNLGDQKGHSVLTIDLMLCIQLIFPAFSVFPREHGSKSDALQGLRLPNPF